MSIKRFNFFVFLIFILVSSCKKKDDAKLPTVSFKTVSGFVSGNTTAMKNEILTVVVIADRNEADLRKLVIKVKYNYLSLEDIKKTYYMNESQASHFESEEYDIKTGNQNGSETWTFEVTDKDGNIGTNTIVITVQ